LSEKKKKQRLQQAPSLDGGEKNRPHQTRRGDVVGTDPALNAPKHHRFDMEWDLRSI
jgi:hypothetical protein